MPRARDVVMKKLDTRKLRQTTIERAIKLYSPYEVISGELCGTADAYCIVYTAPLGGDRKIMANRNVKSNAVALRDMLNEAWAEGRACSAVG